jgi:hypothetical protein
MAQDTQFDDADLELELKPIIEKDFGLLSVILNPLFEKTLYRRGHDQGFEFGYRNGVYYRWLPYLSPGIEFYGGIGLIYDSHPLADQQNYIYPVLWGQLPRGIVYNLGPGFGLTRGSDHVLMKFNPGAAALRWRAFRTVVGFELVLLECQPTRLHV